MSGRIRLCVLMMLAVLAPSTLATAQTVDGVGDRTTATTDASADDAADAIEDLVDLYEYQPRMYQLALRSWFIKTPGFLLDAFFSKHTNMWTEGIHNFSYGLEFTTRIPDKFDVVTSVDWANLRTPDGFWLEDDDPVQDADFTSSNLTLLSLDVGLNWFTPLGRREDFNLYYGFGLGMAITLGRFDKYDIDAQRCGWLTPEQRASTRAGDIDDCVNDVQSRDESLPYFEETRTEEDRILPVFPAVSGTLGLRYLLSDHFQVSIEGGLKTLYFFGGLEFGYFWSPVR